VGTHPATATEERVHAHRRPGPAQRFKNALHHCWSGIRRREATRSWEPHRLSRGAAAARRSDCEADEAVERLLRDCIVAVCPVGLEK
jgi:hypothetical protein